MIRCCELHPNTLQRDRVSFDSQYRNNTLSVQGRIGADSPLEVNECVTYILVKILTLKFHHCMNLT